MKITSEKGAADYMAEDVITINNIRKLQYEIIETRTKIETSSTYYLDRHLENCCWCNELLLKLLYNAYRQILFDNNLILYNQMLISFNTDIEDL